ncbi:MAG: hypothetical protein LAN37_03025 [Acidobacteriia bacterium]|nr:hypothetical protein [Terriglobia bacterium]
MSTATVSLREIAAQWRAARRIYPIYAGVVRHFDIGIQPCRDLESPIDRNDPEILEKIASWFDSVDERSHAGHLRQALQTAHVAKEDNLRELLRRFLEKEQKSASDRDKIDFLLVQYFAQCAPHAMHNRALELEDIAEVLEPVLGEAVPQQPRWLQVLDSELAKLGECKSLRELLEKGVLAHVRQLKEEAGEMYFGSGALLAFTRFNFAARHAFFRLLHADLGIMRQALLEIEHRGIKTLDCKRAGLSAQEPLESLARICHDWKTPFRAPYAAGKPFEQMMGVMRILQEAVAEPVPKPQPATAPPAVEPAREASTHEISFETADGKIPTEIMKAAAAPAVEGPSTTEIPVYGAGEETLPHAETPQTPALDVQACREHISEQLIGEVQPTPTSVATVYYKDTKVLLSSWEVTAYTQGGNDSAEALQRAVAARTVLLEAVERKKKRVPAADLPDILKLAHAELALLQESIAKAKDAKDIDAAVNLAATCKRLLSLIDEAEKLSK